MEYPVSKETVTLEYPIVFNGKEYKALELRRPLVKDQLIADKQNKDSADKEIHFMSLLAEVDVEVIQMLDLDDYEKVQETIKGFRKKECEKLSEREVQQGLIVLASHTGWSISEMLNLPMMAFIDFIELLPKKDGK